MAVIRKLRIPIRATEHTSTHRITLEGIDCTSWGLMSHRKVKGMSPKAFTMSWSSWPPPRRKWAIRAITYRKKPLGAWKEKGISPSPIMPHVPWGSTLPVHPCFVLC